MQIIQLVQSFRNSDKMSQDFGSLLRGRGIQDFLNSPETYLEMSQLNQF